MLRCGAVQIPNIVSLSCGGFWFWNCVRCDAVLFGQKKVYKVPARSQINCLLKDRAGSAAVYSNFQLQNSTGTSSVGELLYTTTVSCGFGELNVIRFVSSLTAS